MLSAPIAAVQRAVIHRNLLQMDQVRNNQRDWKTMICLLQLTSFLTQHLFFVLLSFCDSIVELLCPEQLSVHPTAVHEGSGDVRHLSPWRAGDLKPHHQELLALNYPRSPIL